MRRRRPSAPTCARISVGLEVSGIDYARALRFRERWRLALRRAFAATDLIVVPTTPGPAPPVDQSGAMGKTSNWINKFNFTWSLAGVPALSVPCGCTSAGLPFAMQLVAPWWCEELLFRAGAAYQAVTDWHLRRAPALDAGG